MKFKILNIFIIYRVLCKKNTMFLSLFMVCVCGGNRGGTGVISTFSSRLRLLGDINFPVGDINFFGNLKPY